MVKNPPANPGDARDAGSIPGSRRSSQRRRWQPAPVFLPETLDGGARSQSQTRMSYQAQAFIYLAAFGLSCGT